MIMPPRTRMLVSTSLYLASASISLLPFLYQTRTLQSQLLSRNEKGAHRRFYSIPRKRVAAGTSKSVEIPFEASVFSRNAKKSSHLDGSHKSHETPFKDSVSSRTAEKTSQLDGSRKSYEIPFEGSVSSSTAEKTSHLDGSRKFNVSRSPKPAKQRNVQLSPSQTTVSDSIIPHSTLTASEKAVFDKIFKDTANEKTEVAPFEDEFGDEFGDRVTEDFNKIFESAIERQSSLEENPATASPIVCQSSEAMRLDTLQKSHAETFTKKLDSAETDIEVWTLLETDVFWLIGELEKRSKDTKMGEATPSVKKGKAPKMGRKKGIDSTRSIVLESENIVSIMQNNYGGYCLSALRLLRREFPRSPYVLHLLPTIKRLGPISYVLGASTALYNEILFMKWTQYSDLGGMAVLVKEMLDRGVEVNEVSISLLVAVARERQRALSADKDVAPATKAWWRLSGVQESWHRVRLLLDASIQDLRRRRAHDEKEQMNDGDKDNIDSLAAEGSLHQDSTERGHGHERDHRRVETPAEKGASPAFHRSKKPRALVRYIKLYRLSKSRRSHTV